VETYALTQIPDRSFAGEDVSVTVPDMVPPGAKAAFSVVVADTFTDTLEIV
jgi:hypothetical protein